jgi:hypothetical protein
MVGKKRSRNDVNREVHEDFREPRREDFHQKKKEKKISALLKSRSVDPSLLTEELEDD